MMEFFKKLDADGAGGPWVKPFLDAFDKRLRGDMPTQEIFYFRSSLGRKVLRPVIESIERSGDGCSCTCRVVFLEGFNPPMVRDPSMVEQLADGLRLAFRTRNEVLNKYKEKLDVKRQLISGPNGLSDQIVEIMGTIRQEATMQGYQLDGTASEFFLGKDKSEYNRIHNEYESLFVDFKKLASERRKSHEAAYTEIKNLFQVLQRNNDDYFKTVGPRFLQLLSQQS
jgi:hypothetical protein